MDIGLALPQMTTGLDRPTMLQWCQAIDSGPFSSISAGERITFHNLDGFTLCSAAAVLTERVRVLLNVAVLPWHAPAMAAQELASIDVLSNGRLEVAVGVGGRADDYSALGSAFTKRFQRLDDGVAQLRHYWNGGTAADGKSVGPTPIHPGGPPILASAMGPKSLARAAKWADGISGFSLTADAEEMHRANAAAGQAWMDAGRSTKPKLLPASFFALGPDAPETLQSFGYRYLEVFSPDLADALSRSLPLHNDEALRNALVAARDAGCDEFILVPADASVEQVTRVSEVVQSL